MIGGVLQWMEEWGCGRGETEQRGPGREAGWREAGKSEVEMGDRAEWERSCRERSGRVYPMKMEQRMNEVDLRRSGGEKRRHGPLFRIRIGGIRSSGVRSG